MKKFLSILIVVLMIVNLFPMAAFAADAAPMEMVASISAENTVTLQVKTTAAFEWYTLEFTLNLPEGCTISAISKGADYDEIGGGNFSSNKTSGIISVVGAGGEENENASAEKEVVTVTIDTTDAVGDELSFGMTVVAADIDGSKFDWSSSTVTSNTLNLSGGSSGEEDPEIPTNVTYTADLDTTSSAVKVGDKVTVNILVGGTSNEFASSELNLTYTGLTYVSGESTVNGADVTAANGAIKIIDHGESTSWTEGNTVTAYALVFTVDSITGASGTASVTLSDAALSKAADASGSNLTSAIVTVNKKEFTVTPADLTVTLPTTGELTAPNGTTVTYGDEFTFEAVNKNYTYEISVKDADDNTVTATETASGSGVWTITNVTSDLTITIVSKTAKTYTITFTNKDHIQNQTTDTVSFVYGTEGGFSFTLKDNVSAGLSAGTTYAVDSIKYTGTDTNVEHTAPGTDVTSNRTYTIATEAITGNITITTSATTVNPNQFTVTLPTSTYPELTADKTVVGVNGSVVLMLDPVAGYKYTVTYKIGDDEATEIGWTETEDTTDGDKLTYTISNITANVTVSVTEKVIDTSKFTVNVMTEYVAMDGKSVHLVRVSGTLDSGYVLTYADSNMYWSTGYATGGEYVYLVITDADTTLSVADATAQIGIAQGTPVATITYDGNVNLADTTTVDANDAQLVWNMYQANVYSDFATEATGATMEKYLRADMNHDGKIYTEDAAAIITLIRNRAN